MSAALAVFDEGDLPVYPAVLPTWPPQDLPADVYRRMEQEAEWRRRNTWQITGADFRRMVDR